MNETRPLAVGPVFDTRRRPLRARVLLDREMHRLEQIATNPARWLGLLGIEGFMPFDLELGRRRVGWPTGSDDLLRPSTTPCRWASSASVLLQVAARVERAGGADRRARRIASSS